MPVVELSALESVLGSLQSFLPVTVGEAALAIIIVFFSSAIQSSFGIGGALIAAPALLLINPVFVPMPVLVANIFVSALASRREWHAVHHQDLFYMLAGRVAGTIPALILLGLISQKSFDLTFGVTLLIAVALSLTGLKVTVSRLNLFLAGSLSGLMGTASSIGGPPTALVYRQVDGARFRATMSMQLLVGGLISVIGLLFISELKQAQLIASALLLPGVLGGYCLSRIGFERLNREAISFFVLAISVFSALLVILKAIM
jgi:uncharacterized membrane protein YfcA